jgi:hypothetical protein
MVRTGWVGLKVECSDRSHPVYDPRRPTQLVPAPRNQQGWVAWLRRHPYLRARQLGAVTVGGVRGVQLETDRIGTGPSTQQRPGCTAGMRPDITINRSRAS